MTMLFLQKVVFPYIGTGYVSSFLKKNGIGTSLVFYTNHAMKEATKIAPTLVGIYCMTGEEEYVKRISREIRQALPATRIIVGGPHPTYFHNGFEDCKEIDYLCRGEGDNTELLELFHHINNGEAAARWKGNNILSNVTPPVTTSKLLITEHLDSLPFPDMDLYYDRNEFKHEDSFILSTSRGCPYRCSYCYNSKYNNMLTSKHYVRRHSPGYVIEYLVYLKNKYGSRWVNFQDDVFAIDKTWMANFVELYNKHVRLPYYCNIKSDIFDDDYAKFLYESNCYAVCFGIETGNEELRKKILNRKYSNSSIYKTAELLHKYNIKFVTTNIVGLPDESLENSWETIRLNNNIKTTSAWCSIFVPYPGTPLAEYAIEKGYIKREQLKTLPESYFNNSILNKPDINEQVNLHKFFGISSRLKFVWPIVKMLTKLRANKLFDYIFYINFIFYRRKIYHQKVLSIIRMLYSYYKNK